MARLSKSIIWKKRDKIIFVILIYYVAMQFSFVNHMLCIICRFSDYLTVHTVSSVENIIGNDINSSHSPLIGKDSLEVAAYTIMSNS